MLVLTSSSDFTELIADAQVDYNAPAPISLICSLDHLPAVLACSIAPARAYLSHLPDAVSEQRYASLTP